MAVYRATVRLNFPVGSGGGTNTWHMRTSGGVISDATAINALMGAVRDFYTAIRVHVPTGYTFAWDGTYIERTAAPAVNPPGTPWSVSGTAGSTQGYGAAAGMACVTWRSPLATRRGRGRTFIGPLSAVAVQTDGTLSGTALGNFRDAAAALVTASQGGLGDGALGVWSEKDGVLRDFIASSVTDQIAVLRSRRG